MSECNVKLSILYDEAIKGQSHNLQDTQKIQTAPLFPSLPTRYRHAQSDTLSLPPIQIKSSRVTFSFLFILELCLNFAILWSSGERGRDLLQFMCNFIISLIENLAGNVRRAIFTFSLTLSVGKFYVYGSLLCFHFVWVKVSHLFILALVRNRREMKRNLRNFPI